MEFKDYKNLSGQHAFLSPSSPYWLRYDIDKLRAVYANHRAATLGTELHAFAANAIDLGIKLPKSRKTINMFVNDSIGYRQATEKVLYYSPNCFGTADSIQFRNNILRIFDLKTGTTPAHREQLEVYAALFCLNYGMRPDKISMDLRLYQNDDIDQWEPEPDSVHEKMEIIKSHDAEINLMNSEGV